MTTKRIDVVLNGTSKNPFYQFGLRANPFPAIAEASATAANEILRTLASDPIKGTDDLRQKLQGCSEEFIDLCIVKYEPGKVVRFTVCFTSE